MQQRNGLEGKTRRTSDKEDLLVQISAACWTTNNNERERYLNTAHFKHFICSLYLRKSWNSTQLRQILKLKLYTIQSFRLCKYTGDHGGTVV